MSSKANQYQKKTPIEHVLLRPDTYIGDVEETTEEMWVVETDKIVKKKITFVPGFLKTFDELLVNARDASVNDKTCNTIKVDYDIENGSITVWNNGQDGIPVEEHPEHKTLVPSMIFGELLTSSNYDDNKKRRENIPKLTISDKNESDDYTLQDIDEMIELLNKNHKELL